jgi:hypothetical protein
MIRIFPYRRRLLDPLDGCASVTCLVAVGLACHKGDASQAQTSTQTGAQTAGVVTQGNQNHSNTGTETHLNLNTAPRITNQGGNVNTGTTYQAGANSTISIQSGVPVTDVQSGLQSILSTITGLISPAATAPASTAPQTVYVQAATSPTTPTSPTMPTDGTSANNTPAPSTDTSGTPAAGTVSYWQLAAAIAAIIGTLYLIFKRRKTA